MLLVLFVVQDCCFSSPILESFESKKSFLGVLASHPFVYSSMYIIGGVDSMLTTVQ